MWRRKDARKRAIKAMLRYEQSMERAPIIERRYALAMAAIKRRRLRVDSGWTGWNSPLKSVA